MSHRTVAAHLHHTFPKLGISTRAALHNALSRYDSQQVSNRHDPTDTRHARCEMLEP